MLFTFLFASPASAEVNIILKNGSSIYADFCDEAFGTLTCTSGNSTFEIEKQDISSMRQVPLLEEPAAAQEEEAVEEGEPLLEGEETAEPELEPEEALEEEAVAEEELPAEEEKAEAVPVEPPSEEGINRLDEITKRKLELKGVRETLLKDRDRLQLDAKKAGVVRSQQVIDQFAKRADDLQARIAKFNKELEVLNKEEEKLLAGMKKEQ
jgi:hypothetical protein